MVEEGVLARQHEESVGLMVVIQTDQCGHSWGHHFGLSDE